MGDGGDVGAVLGEDVTDRQAASTCVVVAGEVVQMPLIGPHRTMEPDRVIEADTTNSLIRVALIHREMGGADRVAGEIVGHVCQSALIEKRLVGPDRFRNRVGDSHPGRDPPGTVTGRAFDA